MELPKKLQDEIWEYCRLNKITGIDSFIIKMVKQGFTVEKYGATPSERIVEKEVEKIVEVPVEKIVEVKVTDNNEFKKVLAELEVVKRDESIHKKVVYDSAKQREELKKTIVELTNKIDKLETELEVEKAKPKEENKKDIYGEGKKGTFGSNISDIWKNRNKQ